MMTNTCVTTSGEKRAAFARLQNMARARDNVSAELTDTVQVEFAGADIGGGVCGWRRVRCNL